MAPTKYSVLWENEPQYRGWLRKSDKKDGASRAKCLWCNSDFSVGIGGKYDVNKHMRTELHKEMANAKVKQKSVAESFAVGENHFLIFLLHFIYLYL